MVYWPGESVSDFNVEWEYEHLRCFIKDTDETHEKTYSTANIFHRVRLGVALGEIDYQAVAFVWNDEVLLINEFGSLDLWPEGFLDQAEYSEDILMASFAKKKVLSH